VPACYGHGHFRLALVQAAGDLDGRQVRRRVRVCPSESVTAQRDDVLPAGIGLEAERRFIRNRVLPQLTFKPALGDRPCVAQVVVAGIGCRSELLSALLHQADLVIC